MPSQVNKYAPGLLDWLGIRAQGQLPNTLSDEIVTAVDLAPFYNAANLRLAAASNNIATGTTGQVYHTVPSSEGWLALWCCANVVQNIGYDGVLQVTAQLPLLGAASTPFVPLTPVGGSPDDTVAINVGSHFVGGPLNPPIFLPPGSIITCLFRGWVAAAPAAVRVSIGYIPMPS